MSKDSDDKLPWGLKQSQPGSMRTITKDKIEAFEHGVMNLNKKHMSKKEQEEMRRRQEEQAAAELIRDFTASFEGSNQTVKTFIKGSTINPATKEEKLSDKGALYKPTSKFQEKLLNQNKLTPTKPDYDRYDRLKKPTQEKKKSNIEAFKEELKRIQEERESRRKNKHQKNEERSKNDSIDIKISSDAQIVSHETSKQSIEDNVVTTNIFLSNLNSNTKENDLMEIFGKYGPLASVKIMWPRSEEEKQRGANCGFVAFMARKDADTALKELDGLPIDGVSLRLSWSKPVTLPPQPIYIPPHLLEVTLPPPPSGLPFNAQPQKNDLDNQNRNLNEDDIQKILENANVKVTIPTERPLLCLIHRMIEFVVREGPEFEAIIMAKEINNPQFRFLFDNQSAAHIYYRWKLFSILQGDSVSEWYDESFQMFKNGSYWLPPVLNSYTRGEDDESYKRARHELEQRKGRLSNDNRDKLEDILRNLTCDRLAVGSAMVFCIDHAECAEEIVECIIESLSIEHTPLNKKIARLFLVSDILHNCHVKVANASYYRRGFEKHLPDLFKHINSVWLSIDSKMKSEAFKKKVINCLKAWQELAIYPMEYLMQLQNTFLGFLKNNNDNNSNDSFEKFNINNNSNSNPCLANEEDIDGKPLEEPSKQINENSIEDEDIDGKPLIEYEDESIDGKPLSDDDESKNKHKGKDSAKFIASKWEQVDPEQLEKQAVTTSKWDFFDEYQSDKNSTEDSKDAFEGEISSNNDSNSKSAKELNRNLAEQQSYNDSIALYQQYSQQREQLSEEKRQILREIEVQAVKYQDELESGRAERNNSISIQQQVDSYRHHLFRKRFESTIQNSSRNGSNNNSKSGEYSSNQTRRRTSRSRSRSSESRSRSRSRSRSPSNRYRYSSSSSSRKNKQRSRSNSPSRRYKKKLKH